MLAALFFPQLCIHCGLQDATVAQSLCIPCISKMPKSVTTLGPSAAEQRLQSRFGYIHAVAHTFQVGQGVVASIVHSLKYQENRNIGSWCGYLLAADFAPFAADIDAVIPVPLHRSKLNSRGYNQSEIIAEALSAELEKPLLNKVVIRKEKTDSQTRKNRRERLQNVANIFEVVNPAAIIGKHVLLIDDVLTTGATLEALAKVVLQVPSVKVSVATFALASN